MFFSPEDIEHRVLRGNRKPPNSLFSYSADKTDPRIHFALVCASSSCPPIDIYTAENLDKELYIAGKTFINCGGLTFD